MFPVLNLPPASLKITKRSEQYFVWDLWRKKQILLTPEEWVRQHLLHHLVTDLHYPTERLAVEMQIEINQLKRRCDAVLFDRNGGPQLIVECKEPNVALNENVIHQIAQYNAALQTNWLIVSNGLHHITLKIGQTANSIERVDGLMDYQLIL